MEVGSIDDFCPAFVHPDFLIHSLAVGAAAVAAGIIVERYMSALHAFADIDSELAGLTGQDGAGSFFLIFGLEMSGLAVIIIRILPDLLNFEITHGKHLRSGQKGTSHFLPDTRQDEYRSG